MKYQNAKMGKGGLIWKTFLTLDSNFLGFPDSEIVNFSWMIGSLWGLYCPGPGLSLPAIENTYLALVF